MRTGVAEFQSERLRQARQARGLTQVALGKLIGRSSGTVSKWEKGDQAPESDALARLASQLALPIAWFLKPLPDFGSRPAFNRSLAAATREAQVGAAIRLQWLNEVSLSLQEWVDWPKVNVPEFGSGDYRQHDDALIESAALKCRDHWKLGLGPVSDVVLAMENAGVVFVREELGYAKMDGSSRWFATDDRPYVLLASDKANGIRNRFDASHELAHLVLHRQLEGIDHIKRHAEIERQANHFAGAFLLPAESFGAEVSRPSLDTFLALKPRWKVSIAAMIVRCSQLGIVDESYATRLWKNYSARGWRRGEPLDEQYPFEPVRLLPRAVAMLLSDGGFTPPRILELLGLGPSDGESLCGLPERFFSEDGSTPVLASIRFRREGPRGAVPFSSKSADIVNFPGER
ncbi:MAG: ImmA/IrrE family metallo-endopeptidase [Burkholderiaceae bacterium]|nr:ImmA/IrrE family metallo-endopeptidase [Burkholderiaceae bacterium]